MDDSTRARIDGAVKENKILLFMKGTPEFPQCGFSAVTVEILERLAVPYATIDVLADPSVRQGIKDYSQWPTIPQLYIDGEFVGGCDIAREMFANGELEKMVKAVVAA